MGRFRWSVHVLQCFHQSSLVAAFAPERHFAAVFLQARFCSAMFLLVRNALASPPCIVFFRRRCPFPCFLTRDLLLRSGEVRIRGSLEYACGEMIAVGFQKCGKRERATPEGFRIGAKWERQSGVFVAGWSPGCQNRMFWEERATPECMQDANLVEVGICLLPLRPKTERLQAIWKAKRSKGECGEHCERGGSGEGRRLVPTICPLRPGVAWSHRAPASTGHCLLPFSRLLRPRAAFSAQAQPFPFRAAAEH